MDSFEQRFERAVALARHPRIRVSDLEVRLATRYTVDTLTALRKLNPDVAFVWLMGADNLVQLPEWQGWLDIVGSVPVAVFARPTYSLRALAGKAARRFARARLPEAAARGLVDCEPPAWVFLHTRLNPISATEIRRGRRIGE